MLTTTINKATTTQTFEDKARQYAEVESAFDEASGPNEVGSPMPGVIVNLKVKEGDTVVEGEPLATLSAMKMETVIPASVSGTVKHVAVNIGDKVEGDDLLVEIE